MKIAILPGDGIGPEITKQAVDVLKALNVGAELVEAPIGGAGYEKFGDPLPDSTLDLAIKSDAVLLGAVGDWKYDTLPRHSLEIKDLSVDYFASEKNLTYLLI